MKTEMITKDAGRRWQRILFVLVLVALPSTFASAQRRERQIDTWKPLHYDVAISLNEELTEISSARTQITLEVLRPNLSNIELEFGEMPIDSVSLSGEPARFNRKADTLNVILPRVARTGEQIKLAINYHGRPKDGLIFAKDRDGKPSATGDNWPNRVHQWIPCLDHPSAKATVSFTVVAPSRETVVANGKFVASTRNPASTSTTWKFEEAKPIPAYCMVIAVSEGAKLDANEPTVTPLSYYVPQRDRDYAPKGFSAAAPSLAFFSETIAPYPYEKLALIVGATRFGGMENSSAIVFSNSLFDLRPNQKMSARFGIPAGLETVVAHEIAHQWFGDSVTETTWADLWLSEGFATYFAGFFVEKHDGQDAFHEYMRGAAARYFVYERQRNAPIHDTETLDLMKLLNENNYEKGAWVLHMLRRRLGDEAFFRGLRAYYAAHRDANATTEDLRVALEKASGTSLKDFFARWIYGSGHPSYQLTWAWKQSKSAAGTLTVTLEQEQAGLPFLMPVPLEILSGAASSRQTIRATGKLTVAKFNLKEPPTELRLDPDETILKEASVARGQ
jgi:aminopeptidase N